MTAPDLFGSPPSLAGKQAVGLTPIDLQFELFWGVYPRKDDKATARKAYAKALKKVTAASLLAAAVIYAESNRDTSKKYLKLAATWLNGECWNNDPPQSVAAVMSYHSSHKVLPPDPEIDPAMQERVGSLLRSLASALRQGQSERAYVARREVQERARRREEHLVAQGVQMRQRPLLAKWEPSQELIDLVRRQNQA